MIGGCWKLVCIETIFMKPKEKPECIIFHCPLQYRELTIFKAADSEEITAKEEVARAVPSTRFHGVIVQICVWDLQNLSNVYVGWHGAKFITVVPTKMHVECPNMAMLHEVHNCTQHLHVLICQITDNNFGMGRLTFENLNFDKWRSLWRAFMCLPTSQSLFCKHINATKSRIAFRYFSCTCDKVKIRRHFFFRKRRFLLSALRALLETNDFRFWIWFCSNFYFSLYFLS